VPKDVKPKERDESAELADIVTRLTTRFPDAAPGEVKGVVDEVYASMTGAHVRDFVGVLVEREAKKALKKAHPKH
jgi:hypothetical protein